MFIGEMVLLALALVAATGKIGAVLTEFFFPLLALTCLVGALITWTYRIETEVVWFFWTGPIVNL